MRELHAHGSGEAVAHGTEAPGRHPAVRLLELEELRRPHLVLTDFGGDVDVAVAGERVEPLDGVLRLDELVRAAIREALASPPFIDLLPPCAQRRLVGLDRGRAPQPDHVFQDVRAIADFAASRSP